MASSLSVATMAPGKETGLLPEAQEVGVVGGGDWPLGRSREASPQFTANMHFSRARAQLGLVRSKSLAVTSLNLKKKKKRERKSSNPAS